LTCYSGRGKQGATLETWMASKDSEVKDGSKPGKGRREVFEIFLTGEKKKRGREGGGY